MKNRCSAKATLMRDKNVLFRLRNLHMAGNRIVQRFVSRSPHSRAGVAFIQSQARTFDFLNHISCLQHKNAHGI